MAEPKEIEALLYICGGCGAEKITQVGEEPPYGFHGDVMHVDASGGGGGAWYACRPSCIRKAVENADVPNPEGFVTQ